MSTFLSKFFKPKWQSNHTNTRIEALGQLDPHNEADQAILLTLATKDPVTEVKAAAIARIEQTQALIDLHQHAETDTKPFIEQRLYALANAQSLSIFDLILDAKLLTEMIIKSASPDTFINGLARIEAPESLLAIATQGKTSKIRQAAAELIETEQTLKALTNNAKSKDKTVYHIAKTKLEELKAQIKAQADIEQGLQNLLTAIQEHAKTDNTKLYAARLESLKQRWQEIGEQAKEHQRTQFKESVTLCETRAEKMVAAQEHEMAEAAAQASGDDEQHATLQTLTDTLSRLRSTAATIQEISALDAIIKTQENRWLEATRQSSVERSEHKHYQLLMGQLRHYLTALRGLAERSADIETLISGLQGKTHNASKVTSSSNKLSAIVKAISWPEDFPKPGLLSAANTALGHSQDIKQKLIANAEELQTKIDQQIQQLDKFLEDKQIKQSTTSLKSIQRLLSQLSAKQGEKTHNQLNLRIKQLNELRDWQGFASSPRQQALCEAMERLSEQSIEPRDKADKIKAMQKEWKALGGASDQSLWERFKAASDRAYEPCKAYFDEQRQLKSNNLERRKILIEQLNSFVEGNDWQNTDWKAAEKINQKARLEWKAAFPVDFKANKAIQSQFNTLLNKMDQQLSTERNNNLKLKQQVVDSAKALITLADLDAAITQAKSLQQQWQAVGITPHKEDRALWREFRSHCDAIFARREQVRDEKRHHTEQAIQASESFITDLQNRLDSSEQLPLEDLRTELANARKQFKQLPSLPANKLSAIQTRFEALLQQFKQQIRQQENQEVILKWREIQRKSDFLRQHYPLQAALNGEQLDSVDSEFESQFKLAKDIESKLKALWISIKAQAVSSEHIIDLEQARSICIRCEIAAGIDSPDSDKDLRMQLQVSRLSEGIASSEHHSREDQLSDLLEQWYLSLGLNQEQQSSFNARVNTALEALFL